MKNARSSGTWAPQSASSLSLPALIKKSDDLFAAGAFQNAAAVYAEISLLKDCGKKPKADALQMAGLCFDRTGKLDEAIESFERALELYKSINPKSLSVAITLRYYCSTLRSKKLFPEALKAAMASQDLIRVLYGPEHFEMGVSSFIVGTIELEMGQVVNSKQSLANAEELCTSSRFFSACDTTVVRNKTLDDNDLAFGVMIGQIRRRDGRTKVSLLDLFNAPAIEDPKSTKQQDPDVAELRALMRKKTLVLMSTLRKLSEEDKK